MSTYDPWNAPQFTHDCSNCVFLSRSNDGTHDLYICHSAHLGDTFVARYGNEGPEYTSANEHILQAVADLDRYVAEAAALSRTQEQS